MVKTALRPNIESAPLCLPWKKCHRLVSSQFPPINLYESILDPEDLDAAFELEALTNPRLRDEAGDLGFVAPEDRVSGPGSSAVMAAFTHIGAASRFTDGRYGVYYAGDSSATAIAETRFHRERFLAATEEPDTRLTLREYVTTILSELHDVRAEDELHDPDLKRYKQTQPIAAQFREQGSHGLLYRSVRHAGGECVAILKPRALKVPLVQAAHYQYVYSENERRITDVFKMSRVPGVD
ncbi:MAG: hypothetical protein CME36_16260 [unclassified Hahellaceae]|nr:hypothetical protein [Hahellaceae bacterium]|tara:strand:- start:96754 stop:97470 length:717 start_codon:yes stop_codon:yes gene_type:complete